MTQDTTQWFTSWFDTSFYHTLYKERNDIEAQAFMDNITNYLNIPSDGTILDLGCGKGRHARYLNQIGFDVTGIDLSKNSIDFAKKFENKRLHFKLHDMREPFYKKYDAVFNLFTSFGYFEKDEDHLNALLAIKNNLNDSGFGMIDFMNSEFVKKNLVPEEIKTMEGIDFHLKRYENDGYIIKDITFTADGENYHFQERVRAFNLDDFERLFEKAGLTLLDVFGDYKLSKYHMQSSDRLIMIFK